VVPREHVATPALVYAGWRAQQAATTWRRFARAIDSGEIPGAGLRRGRTEGGIGWGRSSPRSSRAARWGTDCEPTGIGRLLDRKEPLDNQSGTPYSHVQAASLSAVSANAAVVHWSTRATWNVTNIASSRMRGPGRVEDWRGTPGGSLAVSAFPASCRLGSPWARLQPPPRRTERADFPHSAVLLFTKVMGPIRWGAFSVVAPRYRMR